MTRIIIAGSPGFSAWQQAFRAITQVAQETFNWNHESKVALNSLTLVHPLEGSLGAVAAQFVAELKGISEPHQLDEGNGEQAMEIRNQGIVDLGAEYCLSFERPDEEPLDITDRCLEANIEVRYYYEDI